MAIGSKFQKIKPVYISNLNPRNVPKRLDELCTLHAVDDQGALPRNVSAVPHFTLPGTNSVAVFRFLRIRISIDLLQNINRRRCFLNALG